MAENEEIPEYLKELPKGDPIKSDGGFGPEDEISAGRDDIDPFKIIAKHGYSPDTPLDILIKALIIGNSPNVPQDELVDRYVTAVSAITGIKSNGRPIKDDNDLLLEIAWRYFLKARNKHHLKDTLPLRPIVREVIAEFARPISNFANSIESLERRLVEKFKTNKALLLTRATMDGDYDRLVAERRLINALLELESVGIKIDPKSISLRRLSIHRSKTEKSVAT